MGGWQQEVLSELVGHSFISSEERDRALSFTDDEANEVLASAIQVRPPTTARSLSSHQWRVSPHMNGGSLLI